MYVCMYVCIHVCVCIFFVQILDLVHVKSTGQPHFRVAAETISVMMARNMALSELHLLQPLTNPLTYLLEGISSHTHVVQWS